MLGILVSTDFKYIPVLKSSSDRNRSHILKATSSKFFKLWPKEYRTVNLQMFADEKRTRDQPYPRLSKVRVLKNIYFSAFTDYAKTFDCGLLTNGTAEVRMGTLE